MGSDCETDPARMQPRICLTEVIVGKAFTIRQLSVSFARLNSDSLGGQVENSLAAPMKADGLGPLSQRIVGHRSRGLDESLQAGTIYEVKNTNDSGADSLRHAIT